jgi:hypothetical protein
MSGSTPVSGGTHPINSRTISLWPSDTSSERHGCGAPLISALVCRYRRTVSREHSLRRSGTGTTSSVNDCYIFCSKRLLLVLVNDLWLEQLLRNHGGDES